MIKKIDLNIFAKIIDFISKNKFALGFNSNLYYAYRIQPQRRDKSQY
jgi:hypothetical protein